MTTSTPNQYNKAKAVQQSIQNYIVRTPLIKSNYQSNKCSQLIGHKTNVYLKLENLQNTNSFKARGALNSILNILETVEDKSQKLEFVCASGGNHGLGVCYAAQTLGYTAHVFVNETVPQYKRDAILEIGGTLHVFGPAWDESNIAALEFTAQQPSIRKYVHPFDDENVILGQGTIAVEVYEQFSEISNEPIDAIVVSVGGGGLSSGVASVIKSVSPSTKVYCVESTGAASMHTSLVNDQVTPLESVSTICEGLAAKKVSERTFGYVKSHVEKSFLVTDKEAMDSLREVLQRDKQFSEPSASCSVAALPQILDYHLKATGKPATNIIVVLCGGNFAIDKLTLLQ